MGQVEKVVETKANTTLVLVAICGVGTGDCALFVLLHLIA